LKRVKGKLRGKRILVYGINQLRLRPMVMFGPPEYEPCGEALKLFSDVRVQFSSRALSGVKKAGYDAKGEGGAIEKEKSISGEGEDSYRYIHLRPFKNKFGPQNLESYMRLWVTDENGEGRGFDPVFDTYAYLLDTGQLKGKRASMRLGLKAKSGRMVTKPFDWMTFKKLILADRATIKELCKKIGFEKPLMIRDFCKKQMESGTGLELFFEHRKFKLTHKEDSDDTEASDE
jgi:hypothetical protein